MSVCKNQIIPLQIENLSSDGNGVGHFEGQAVFVPGTAPGDELQVRIVKDCKKYAYGIVEKILRPADCRIPTDCEVARPCGGCCYRHLTYEAELHAKQDVVAGAFARIGGFSTPVSSILPSPQANRYRNKVQFPVGVDKDGHVVAGFYAGHSHQIIPCRDCRLQPEVLNRITNKICGMLEQYRIPVYNEAAHTGLVRHIFLRQGYHSGQIMVCLVVNGRSLPHSESICNAICSNFPDVSTILLNVNTKKTNVVTGTENIILRGSGIIRDTICGVPVQLGPLSFYQVNTAGAEQLYSVAKRFAQLTGSETLLDLYCGMGTIGLSMAEDCRELIGAEIVDEAVQSARRNADEMQLHNARFLCSDAGQAAERFAREGLKPDVIVLDPPRKGCDLVTLNAVLSMAPKRVVMVSCNPATAARDCRLLADQGYTLEQIQPVDMFARTKHVECVALMCKTDEK